MTASAEDVAPSVAAALGVALDGWLGSGDEGEAWRLEDGRVLKVTGSASEAAACLALMDAASSGRRMHPGLPAVHAVRRLGTEIEAGAFEGAAAAWAIVRDDIDPLPLDALGDDWEDLLTGLNVATRPGVGPDPERVSELRAAARSAGMARHFGKLLEVLAWLREETGIVLLDINPGNFGISASGDIGPLDMGGSVSDSVWLHRAITDPPLATDAPATPGPE